MKIYETRSVIKIFYYLLAIDGDIDDVEIKHFRSIGLSMDPSHFMDYHEEIENRCRALMSDAGTDRYDLISEAVDDALTNKAKDDDQGITPRLLVWDLFAAAFCNEDYDDAEKRLINHIARKTGVDKSVVLEMETMMKTLTSIQGEINWVQQTNRPYSEVRPIVEELENRQAVITEAAEYLIADEIDADNPYEYKPDFFDKTISKIDKTVRPVTDKVGAAVVPAAQNVGKAAQKTARSVFKSIEKGYEDFARKFNGETPDNDKMEGK